MQGWGALYIEGSELSMRKELSVSQWEGLHASGMIYQKNLPENNHQLYLNLGYIPQDFFFKPGILIPIKDVDDTLQGFVCRKIDADSKYPKYKYNQYFKKNSNLFGANKVQRRISEFVNNKKANATVFDVFIVEGILDVVRLNSLGFNALALMGTNLSCSNSAGENEQWNQFEILKSFAKKLSQSIVKFHIFLDNDAPGLKGAQRIAPQMLRLCNQCDNVFFDYIVIPPCVGKDPDDILKESSEQQSLAIMESNTISPADFLIAYGLNFFANESFDYSQLQLLWENTPYYTKHDILRNIRRQLSETSFYSYELLRNGGINKQVSRENIDSAVQQLIEMLRGQITSTSSATPFYEYPANIPWLDIIEKARVSYSDSDFPVDYASWLRMKQGGPTLRHFLEAQLQQTLPVEPFVISFAKRGDGEFPRVLSLPSPEDLVIETAFLSELLSYGVCNPGVVPLVFDAGSGPVTYYRGITQTKTVSFAYQFNCRSESTDGIYETQGLFKHFAECWNDYNQYLMDCANAYPFDKKDICCIRLDIHRYYDSISRASVKRLLDAIFSIDLLDNDKLFALSLISGDNPEQRKTNLVQWICHKCYEYSYYSPETGTPVGKNDNQTGIPQGPNLSAWLANILLFDLDCKVMECCEKINSKYLGNGSISSGQNASWYARYVDDMIVVASSKEEAEEIKRIIQNELSQLGLTLSDKIEEDEIASVEAYREMIKQNRGIISDPYGSVDGFINTFNETAFSWATLSNYLDRKNLLTYIHSWDAIIASQDNPKELRQNLTDAVNAASEIRYRDYRKIITLVLHSIFNGENIDAIIICKHITDFFASIHYRADKITLVDKTNFSQINRVWPFFAICEAMQLLLISSYENKVLLPVGCKEKLINNQKELARLILKKNLIQQVSQCFFPNDGQFYGLKHNYERWEMALQANATLRYSVPISDLSLRPYSLFRFALSLGISSNMSEELLEDYGARAVAFQFHDLIHRLRKNISAPIEDFPRLQPHLPFRVLCENGVPESIDEDINYSQIYFDAINVIARTVLPEQHFDVLKKRDYLLCHLISEDQQMSDIRLLPSPDENCQKHIIALEIHDHIVKKVFVILPSSQEPTAFNIYPNLEFTKCQIDDCCLDIYECALSNDKLCLPDKNNSRRDTLSQLMQLKKVFQALESYLLDNAVISAGHILLNANDFYPIYWVDSKPFYNGLLQNGELRKFSGEFCGVYKRGCAALEFVGLNVPCRPKDITAKVYEMSIDFAKSDWLENYLGWYSRNLFSGGFLQYSVPQLHKRIQQFFDFLNKLAGQQLSDVDKIVQFFSFRLDYFLWVAEKNIEKEGIRTNSKGSLLSGIAYISSAFLKTDPAFLQYLKGIFSPLDIYSDDALAISRKDVSAWYLIGEMLEKIINKQEECAPYIKVLSAAFKVRAAASHLKSLCFDLKKIKNEVISEVIASSSSMDILSELGLEQAKWYKDEKNYTNISHERIKSLFAELMRTDRNSQQIYPVGFFIIAFLFLKNTYTEDSQDKEEPFNEDDFFKLLCFRLDDWKNSWNLEDQAINSLASDSDKLRTILMNYEKRIGIISKFNNGFDPCNPKRNIHRTTHNSSVVYDRNDLIITTIGNGHYTESIDGEYFWSETWCGDVFLNIAVITQPLADYIHILADVQKKCRTAEDTSMSQEVNNISSASSNQSSSHSTANTDETSSSNGKYNRAEVSSICDKLYKRQKELWFGRRDRNIRKTRIAFCQFNVGHSSYYHLDIREEDELRIKPDYSIIRKDYEKEKNHVEEVLGKTIEICNEFSVDMLLLPEYSVSVEIMSWLIQHLKDTNSELKIWAGTLLNSCDLTEFEDKNLHESISKKIKVPHLANLCVITKEGILYTRGKKYPAVALQEDFCPHNGIIAPLCPSSTDGPEKFVLELICSEIFMATSPANILALAASREKLHNKYLPPKLASEPSFKEDVINDLIAFSNNVGFVANKRPIPPDQPIKFNDTVRRTILFIPACTTRAADFHILGQGNVLAVGLCSVFCNAVSKKLHAGGESCFIGFGSTTAKNAVMPDTPYSGFMPGVLYPPYGRPLDKNEESLVIADIDPYYMNEGKPRQQHLPPPIELIAHIPFLQVRNKQTISIITDILNEVNNGAPASHISDEYSQLRYRAKELLKQLNSHYNVQKGESLELRECYLGNEKYHTKAALLPAALYDFCFLS